VGCKEETSIAKTPSILRAKNALDDKKTGINDPGYRIKGDLARKKDP
jgi:hypothetical protein